MGRWGLLLVGLVLAIFIVSKLWRRYRFRSQLRMDRITVLGLVDLQARGLAPVVVDVRSALAQDGERILGAIVLVDGDWPKQLAVPNHDRLVVVYCACPNEASAALMAQRLMKRGYKRILPLKGGIDAWRDTRLPMETAYRPSVAFDG
jgi:rhodanese-related sulfurtransferase